MNYQIINSLINKLDPELAHSLAIQFLKNLYIPLFPSKDNEILKNYCFRKRIFKPNRSSSRI